MAVGLRCLDVLRRSGGAVVAAAAVAAAAAVRRGGVTVQWPGAALWWVVVSQTDVATRESHVRQLLMTFVLTVGLVTAPASALVVL